MRQRQIADYVLAHRFEAATLAIDALARRCEVSVASANRFVRALGYASYASFREHWQGELKPGGSSLDKLVRQQQAPAGAPDMLRNALQQGGASLQRAGADLDDEQAAALVATLLKAQRVGVFGAEVSAYLAGYFVNYLSLFRGGVDCLPGLGGPTEPFRKLLGYGPGDVLLVISLPRYSALTLELCGFAAQRGIPVAAITDSPAAPVLRHATQVLYAPAGDTVLPASSLAAMALLEGLCSAVAARSPRLTEELPQLSQAIAGHYIQSLA
jgi:DNA-binding MurR/RpiR family transcriptional regulator